MKNFYVILLLIAASAQGQIINFPDQNLKNKLLAADYDVSIALNAAYSQIPIDSNNDNEITQQEALAVFHLNINNSNISELTGLNYFANLRSLRFNGNAVTSFNTSPYPQLQILQCFDNALTSLTLAPSNNLFEVACYGNALNSIDVSSNPNLYSLLCQNNQLTSLLLPASHNIDIDCSNNQLATLNINSAMYYPDLICKNNALTVLTLNDSAINILDCSNNNLQSIGNQNAQVRNLTAFNNQLTSLLTEEKNFQAIDVRSNNLSGEFVLRGNLNLGSLKCDSNYLSVIDVSKCPELLYLTCDNNIPLVHLNVANRGSHNAISFFNCPNLELICVDPAGALYEYQQVSTLAASYGLVNCCVSLYACGLFSERSTSVEGVARSAAGGTCDALSPTLPNFRYGILFNGFSGGVYYTDENGNFFFPTEFGANGIYGESFNSVQFSLPSGPIGGVNYLDFCFTSNWIENDLEAILIPLNEVDPGGTLNYRILVRNIGNTTQSGNISFMFNDNLVDITSVSNAASSQSPGLMTWTFSNLPPFHKQAIDVVMQVNSTSSPSPVNVGDMLAFSASANGLTPENSATNNAFSFSQKVGLSGTDHQLVQLTEYNSSGYIYYLARFKNNTDAPVENVFIYHDLPSSGQYFYYDASRFVDSSHPVQIRERYDSWGLYSYQYLIEGINLSNIEGQNSGYVLFKAHTYSDGISGPIWESIAVFLDCDTAVIADNELAVEGHDLAPMALYPNPVKNVLHIALPDSEVIGSSLIYNSMGSLVLSADGAEVDVSALAEGIYIIKLNTQNGNVTQRFVKE